MDGYDFRLYLGKRLIPVDENTCYQVLEYVDPFCVLGCRRMVTINLLKGRHLTVEERMRASRILIDVRHYIRRRVRELNKLDLSKPDFNTLQKLLKTAEKGTPTYKEIHEKLQAAYREWEEKKRMLAEIVKLNRELIKVGKHIGILRGDKAFKPEAVEHLVTRCFLWDDGEDEKSVQGFIKSFIEEPEFRASAIGGSDERYHIIRIYSLLERMLWEKICPDMLRAPVHTIEVGIYHKVVGNLKSILESHKTYCKTVYQYLKENIGGIVGSEEYRNALSLGDEGIKKFIQQYVFEKVPPPQPI
jgi:hypothetical protein